MRTRHFGLPLPTVAHKPTPRGLARSGPAILSYGFRPFFLMAGIYAVTTMILWLGALSGLWSVGGIEGPVAWHAHEMLFGYATAALAGFVLTAIPNWTGRLPVSGRPLAALFALWLAGRLAGLTPSIWGDTAAAVVDALFLPTLALVVAQEIVAGRNWQNLRLAVGLLVLASLNIAFHVVVLTGGDPDALLRGTIAVYVLLICHVGGRIIPSFTRNYLTRRGTSPLPASAGRFDQVALASALLAGACWSIFPTVWPSAVLCAVTAALHAVRLARWRGWATRREPLLLVLHVAYGFVPIGYSAAALSAIGLLSVPAALHLLTVGVIGMMTLAVMTRASRGHTGRAPTASSTTTVSYCCLLVAAILRPAAELAPNYYYTMLAVSAACWILAFGLFVAEHTTMLTRPSLASRARPHRLEPTR